MAKRNSSLPGRIIMLLAIVIAACTLLSVAAQFVSPLKFWILALFGLGFKQFYIVNIFFLIYFLLRKRKAFLISLVAFVFGFTTAQSVIRIGLSKPSINTDKAIKVLSYNVRLFDLYNWTENLQTRQKILKMLADEQAEILCLQEFYNADDNKFENVDTLLKSQKASYYHIEYQKTIKEKYHFGIATFCTFPIINKGQIIFSKENTNVCIYTDIKVNDDTLRIYNAHLESIRFKKADYEFIDKISEGEEPSGNNLTSAGNIILRLKTAYIKRSRQAEKIAKHIKESPYPAILCGDFNDSPTSYCYKVISEDLCDAFMESGRGFGNTYSGPFPAFRIDFIMHDPALKSANYKTTRQKLSDHYPVSCLIELP